MSLFKIGIHMYVCGKTGVTPIPCFYWNLLSTPMFLKAKLTKVMVKVGTENKTFVGKFLYRNVFDVILSNVGFWPHLSPLTDRFLSPAC